MNHDNDNKGFRFLSVCSGIEAASTAWHPLGWRAVAFSEIEKFPSAVLAHHYPDVPNLGDFTAIDTTKLGQVDILAGGTPCQAFSVAGLRQGLDDARGNLTLKFVELAHELANGNGLRNVVWENVVGVLSDKGNAFGCFLAGLVGADSAIEPPARGKWPHHGMVSGPKGRAAWAVKNAEFFGVAQRRRRVLVVADFGNGADPAAVLFEPEGVFRHPPSRGEAGKDVAHPIAPSIVSSGRGVERTGDTRGQDPVVALLRIESAAFGGNRTSGPLDVATTLSSHGGPAGRMDFASETFVTVAPCLDASYARLHGQDNQHVDSGAGLFVRSPSPSGADANENEEGGVMPAIAFQSSQPGVRVGYVHATLDSNNGSRRHNGAIQGSAVRRLTPMECERLQGFPDGYTEIPWRGKSADQCPDGPRYKALGNSWAVPKFVWLGKRIAQFMPNEKPAAANDNNANDNDGLQNAG